jgi:hypothetical protein
LNKDILAYLDHNILDLIVKDDRNGIKPLLKECNLTPIFSNETLVEIKRSAGGEDKFLTVLNEIGAKFLEPVIENNHYTGTANVHSVDSFQVYAHFLEHEEPLPEYGYGLTGMLEKFYGGRKDESFDEVFASGAEEFKSLLDELTSDLDEESLAELGDEFTNEYGDISTVLEQLNSLPNLLKEQYSTISTDMDKDSLPPIKRFEEELNLGAKVLKNITPPNVVLKIFEKVKNAMPEANLDIDTFFGIKPHSYEEEQQAKSLSEKINAIYHQLNFLGYHRDTGMKKSRGFVRSSSDMTHAGLASYCHLFMSRDEGLVKKTEAAYVYLGVRTRIVYFNDKKSKKSK